MWASEQLKDWRLLGQMGGCARGLPSSRCGLRTGVSGEVVGVMVTLSMGSGGARGRSFETRPGGRPSPGRCRSGGGDCDCASMLWAR